MQIRINIKSGIWISHTATVHTVHVQRSPSTNLVMEGSVRQYVKTSECRIIAIYT